MSQNIYARSIDLTKIVLSAVINIIKGFEKYYYYYIKILLKCFT